MASGRITKITYHYAAFNHVRKSAGVREALASAGHAIADAAGGEPNFVVVETENASRARVLVITATAEAMTAEATDRRLTTALNAGRS